MGGQQKSNSLPKNWPSGITYLTAPVYAPQLTKPQLQSLRTIPSDDSSISTIPREVKPGPCPLVKITPISDPAHPAAGQCGLFAARDLRPDTLIVPYFGEVHPSGSAQSVGSDYDLWLDRDADVAVDAARMGSEARFVNDYRGVPGALRANAEFREVWDVRRGEKGMAVFVLPAGKKAGAAATGIRKGEEILVSYGKGFWGKRMEEAEEDHS